MGTVQVTKQKLKQLKTRVEQLKKEKQELEKKNRKLQKQKNREGKWKGEIKRLGLDQRQRDWVEPDAEKLMGFVQSQRGVGEGTAKKLTRYARRDGSKILLDRRVYDHPGGWKK